MRKATEAELDPSRTGGRLDEMDGSLNQWADKKKNIAMFGYDADLEVDKWWNEKGASEVGTLGLSRL